MQDLATHIIATVAGGACVGMWVHMSWRSFFRQHDAGRVAEAMATDRALARAQSRIKEFEEAQLELFGGEGFAGEGEKRVLVGAKDFSHLAPKPLASLD